MFSFCTKYTFSMLSQVWQDTDKLWRLIMWGSRKYLMILPQRRDKNFLGVGNKMHETWLNWSFQRGRVRGMGSWRGGGWGGNTVYAYFLELHEHNLKQMSHFQTFYSQHEFLDALFDTSLPYQSQKMNEILYFTLRMCDLPDCKPSNGTTRWAMSLSLSSTTPNLRRARSGKTT